MSRSPSRSFTRTLPPFSPAERAVGDRGGTSPPSGRSCRGKPEPPPGLMPIERAPPEPGRVRGDPPEVSRNRKERPWHARGDPPGWSSSRAETRRRSHGPPRQARGDPEPLAQAPPTYGLLSGPSHLARTSYHKDPHRHRGATGPPGAKTAGAVNVWPPPGDETLGRAPPVIRRARGDPPGRVRSSRRGPPGPTRISHSSLSAGRCRERNPDARPETGRHDVARKPKPKSRNITPWL